ncbi:hypothetical protein ABK040_013158 [Willaertia magna]
MRQKLAATLKQFKDPVALSKGWRSFESNEPGAFYPLVFFIIAPFIPVATYYGFKAFGKDMNKFNPAVDFRVKHYYEEKATGKDDVGPIFEYHYSDGTKELAYSKNKQ